MLWCLQVPRRMPGSCSFDQLAGRAWKRFSQSWDGITLWNQARITLALLNQGQPIVTVEVHSWQACFWLSSRCQHRRLAHFIRALQSFNSHSCSPPRCAHSPWIDYVVPLVAAWTFALSGRALGLNCTQKLKHRSRDAPRSWQLLRHSTVYPSHRETQEKVKLCA